MEVTCPGPRASGNRVRPRRLAARPADVLAVPLPLTRQPDRTMRRGGRLVAAAALAAASVVLFASAAAAATPSPEGAPATSVSSRWVLQSTRNPNAPYQNYLDAVSCSSATACMAVGSYWTSSDRPDSGHYVTLAERWNGRKWAVQSTPSPGGIDGSYLDGVACPTARTCVAVGEYYKNSGPDSDVTLAVRWNGKKWARQRTPNPLGGYDTLGSVSCTRPTACTAVGSGDFETLAEHWNGKKWAVQPTPDPVIAGQLLDYGLAAVSCPSAKTCVAVGDYYSTTVDDNFYGTLAERWNGKEWAVQSTPDPDAPGEATGLAGVSCSSGAACVAVGSYYNTKNVPVTLALRWNGKEWAQQPTRSPAVDNRYISSDLTGISCTRATACVAVGDDYYSEVTGPVTLAEVWNGRKWSVQSTPNPRDSADAKLLGLSCTTATACIAVGSYQADSGADLTLAESRTR